MRGIEELNKYLKIFNQESGEYLNLIGDKTKNYPSLNGKIKINDFDNGAIGNVIEYSIQFSEFLILQLDLRYTQGTLLDYILEGFYGVQRLRDETDANYYIRTKNLIFDEKVSDLAIIEALKDYGVNIQLINGVGSGAFTEVSFVGSFEEFDIVGEDVVRPAFIEIQGGNPYFFKVIMSGALPQNYKTIIDIINEYKAGGINYIVELREYFTSAVGFVDTSFIEYDDSDMGVSPIITAGFTGT